MTELPPVLLVHGIAANHRNQDVHPDYSLARYLAGSGRDVWLLTLRSGLSVRSVRSRRGGHGFSAMAEHDLPLAIATVLEKTGHAAIDYIGFSMGGMLLYAALGRFVPAELLRRVVVVGSPGRLIPPRWMRPLLGFVPRWLVPRMRLRFLARLVAFASEWVKTPLHHIIVNPRNMSPGITRASLVNCIEDIPAALGADFLSFAVRGGELSVGGEPVLDGLSMVETPALFVAGSADHVAPAPAVRAAFDAWGSGRPAMSKRFLVAGRDFGHREEYGHGDLVLGTHVGAELFEPIAAFLAS